MPSPIPSVTKQARSQRRRRMEAYAPLDFDGRGEQLRAASASEVGVCVSPPRRMGMVFWVLSFQQGCPPMNSEHLVDYVCKIIYNYTWGEGFEDFLGVQVHDGKVTQKPHTT